MEMYVALGARKLELMSASLVWVVEIRYLDIGKSSELCFRGADFFDSLEFVGWHTEFEVLQLPVSLSSC